MRRRTKIMLVLGAMVLLALGWVVFKPDKEPEYKGKKLSQWAMQLIGDPITGSNAPSETAYEEAGLAIRGIGTNAVPHLVKWISYENPTWRTKLTETLNNFFRTTGLSWKIPYNPVSEDLKVRRRKAVIAFQILGPVAESAIPALSQALYNVKEDDLERALSLGTALAQLGPRHCVFLCAALTNQTFVVRSAAVKVLSLRRDTNYAAAVPALVACLSDRDCRFDAIRALGVQHLRPELSLPALNLMLTNSDRLLQRAAVNAIGEFESDLEFVLLLFHDPDPKAREAATNALRKINPNALPK